MHNPNALTDKVYDALRGPASGPKEHELRFTNFARQATAVLLHTSHVVAETAFKPGHRTQALVNNLTAHHDMGQYDYRTYCARLAQAYNPDAKAEIFAVMDGIISFHYPAQMAERRNTHTARLMPDMTDSMMNQLQHKQHIVSYYHEPDFNDTPFDDVIGKQPHIQNYRHAQENLYNAFGQFQKLSTPYLGHHHMNGLISGLLFNRAFHQTKNMQFKLHFDADKSIVTASGPLFEQNIQSFKDNNFAVSEHTAPLATTTPHLTQNKLWSNLPEQKYYVIS